MRVIFIANWKNYLSVTESARVFTTLAARVKKIGFASRINIIIAPAMLALPELARLRKKTKTKIMLAAQDCGIADSGAYTGAVSPRELKLLGVSYVIVGHSERREHFDETDALVGKKTSAAMRAGLKPIVCVGETQHERNDGRANAVVADQLRAIVKNEIVRERIDSIIMAYEPRWAIGTGIPIAPEDAVAMHTHIRSFVSERTQICYGGSVTPGNVRGFLENKVTSGVLIGGASVSAASFLKIIDRASRG